MTDTNLRARSTSEIVDAAFALYRQNAMQYTLVMAVGYAPILVVNLLLLGGTAPTAPSDLVKAVPGMILSTLLLGVISAMIARMGSDAYLGNPVDLGTAIKAVLPKLPALIVSSILFYLMIGASGILLFIPALYLVARFFATSQTIILENKGVLSSFGRSSVLSKGRKGHILLTMLLTWGIYLVLSVGISAMAKLTNSFVVQQITSSLVAIFAYPVVDLASMVLYYDTRIRAEGFDVEHMSATLHAPYATATMGNSVA